MEAEAAGRPVWCGECDKRTRLVDHGSYMQRCHRCWAWPARKTRFHQLLPQHRLCGGCRNLVYEWDAEPCGKHRQLAIGVTGHQAIPGNAHPAIAARAQQAITPKEDT